MNTFNVIKKKTPFQPKIAIYVLQTSRQPFRRKSQQLRLSSTARGCRAALGSTQSRPGSPAPRTARTEPRTPLSRESSSFAREGGHCTCPRCRCRWGQLYIRLRPAPARTVGRSSRHASAAAAEPRPGPGSPQLARPAGTAAGPGHGAAAPGLHTAAAAPMKQRFKSRVPN